MTESVYVRFVYLTEKGLELIETLEKLFEGDVELQRVPKMVEPPLPRKAGRTSEESETK